MNLYKNMNIIMWHRRDLRTIDNLALSEAQKDGTVFPVFVVDPYFFEQYPVCSSRKVFLIQSLQDLAEQYKKLGSRLILRIGNSIDVLSKMSIELNAQVYFNQDTNSIYGIERDKIAIEKGWRSFQNDAIQRNGRSNDWSLLTKKFFESEIHAVNKLTPHNYYVNDAESKKIETLFNSIKHDKDTLENGGSNFAKLQLDTFISKIKNYPKVISSPLLAEEGGTSRLSTHLSFGTISVREIYQKINKLQLKQKHFFISRLFWNQHFTQKLANNPEIVEKSANPIFEKYYDVLYQYDETIFESWKNGTTGYLLIDASMRALKKTGFLNFRMRAMVASFLTYILKQPWKIGADYMFSQLIDADVAINYSQWQMQSGMVGVHPNRIYNPTKQILEHDQNCEFIKKYIPEVSDIDKSILSQDPEEDTLMPIQYIKPIVSFRQRSIEAKNLYSKINKEAFAAIKRDYKLKQKLGLEEVSNARISKNQLPETKIV